MPNKQNKRKERIVIEYSDRDNPEFIDIDHFKGITEDNILEYEKPIYNGAGKLEKRVNLGNKNVVSVTRIRLKDKKKQKNK